MVIGYNARKLRFSPPIAADISLNDVILISVSGPDRPGVTASIAGVLADHDINVLDIGQAVIHDQLSLGLLVEVGSNSVAQPRAELEALMAAMDLSIGFTGIARDDYAQWVEEQGKDRHIVTLLARKISAAHIASVTGICANHGMNIDRIDRLSGRVALDAAAAPVNACVEFSMRGPLADAGAFRRELLHLAADHDIDIAYQEDNMFRRTRRLVAFDMDSTLIECEVIDELAKEAGVGEQVAVITESAMRGEIDFKESFHQRLALLKGLDESVLQDIAARLPLTEGAEQLVTTLQRLGYKTAILSGGFMFFGNYLKQRLGINYVYANKLEIVDGKVTGRVTGDIVDGERKAKLLREIAAKEGLALEQVIAVGDGANDLPMLSIAGLGIAFRAKPTVKENAEHSISTLGLDGILYLLGIGARDLKQLA